MHTYIHTYTEWATWTCIYGWSVQGLVPKFGEPVGINACARSNRGDVLAVTNDFGKLLYVHA